MIRTFFRSFFIQGCWNFTGMQNVGFAFGISPVVCKAVKDNEGRSAALLKSLELFNTHPYMATAILGAAAGMELTGGKNVEVNEERISEMKKMLSGSLAGLGDSFFWATLKPLFSITAIISGFMGGIVAPLIFLFLYNSFHIWMRIKGFLVGLERGIKLVDFLRGLKLPEVTERLTGLIAVLTGTLLSGLIFFMPRLLGAGDWGAWGELRFLAIIPLIVLFILTRRGFPLLIMLYVFAFFCMAGFYALG
ncbi:MAG: PTS system mannose/fructose/sorbose family transporter subunit IID [Deltaproteobacteria bacterium]|uniref:PTS system mannose/fructose/sorbose family transporter subunit IID n=1 Tax=Candidatus Zymogenus saltonus TaxID=2844893 RepID=A0A9D8KHH3_9DELT|nr:PTS system mannose/fructose/sorbose family transporter subunit IID [Candidatus Zymogenus saltonus]